MLRNKKLIPDRLLFKQLSANFANLGVIQISNALIQLLLIPIIVKKIGISEFGMVTVANAFASLCGLFVNYGTSISGIQDTAKYKNNSNELSMIFYSIFSTRLIIFIISLLSIPLLFWIAQIQKIYIVFAIPLVVAEMVNPLFFFNGLQKLFIYNITNLISKICSALLIIFLVGNIQPAWWVNFYLGITSMAAYLFLVIYAIKKWNLPKFRFLTKRIATLLKKNIYLVGNNVSVQLQQSFFLFVISALHLPLLLGAYAICDKIIWAFKMMIIAFSSAIFPHSVKLYENNKYDWSKFKLTCNKYLLIIFVPIAIGLWFFAPLIVQALVNHPNPITVHYIKTTCLVPLVVAVNSLNVIDLLLKNQYKSIFIISVTLLILSITLSYIFIKTISTIYFGFYLLLIEFCSIPIYLYFINRKELEN